MATLEHRWRRTRIAGLVFALIPLGILLLFTLGETIGGDVYGLQHVVQALPLALLIWVAWRWPSIGGPVLVGVSVALGGSFLVAMGGRLSAGVALGTALVFFAPSLVAGVLFWLSGRSPAARHDASVASPL